MPWIPLHQTWQIYPHQLSVDALNTITPKLGRATGRSHIWQICLADLPPSSIDALHTTTLNLADLTPPLSIHHGKTCILHHFDILYLFHHFQHFTDGHSASLFLSLSLSCNSPSACSWNTHLQLSSFSGVVTFQLTACTQLKCSCGIIVIFHCHQFATDHLQEYV